MKYLASLFFAFLASLGFFGTAHAAAVDVAAAVADIGAQAAPVGAIGLAILGITVAVAAFMWLKKGIK